MKPLVRAFFALIRLGFIAQFQYRASLATQTFGTFLFVGLDYLAAVTLMSRFGNVKGWTLGDLSILMGSMHIAFRLADTLSHGLDNVGLAVRQGTFDRYLLRPMPVFLQLVGERITVRRMGAIMQGVVILSVGFSLRPNLLTPPFVALLAWCIFCGSAFFLGLFTLRAAVSFRIWEGIEFMNIFIYGGRDLVQYPGTIFPFWVRRLMTFVLPYLCLAYIPLQNIVHPGSPLPSWPQAVAPLSGLLFLGISIIIFNTTMNRRAL